MIISFTLNGRPRTVDTEPATLVAELLREKLLLAGTHFGCDTSQCGACVVLFNGEAVKSCTLLAPMLDGATLTTIEGLSVDSSHPLQKAWLAEQVPQCGYCQSGQIMSAADLLSQTPQPTRAQIVEHMSTNICRCGTYQRIVRAVERAAREV